MAHSLPPEQAQAHAVQSFDPAMTNQTSRRVLVIGSGPAGVRFAHEILKREPQAQVTLFSNEPYEPYNRVMLSSLLVGDVNYEDIIMPLPDPALFPGFSQHVATITHIDTQRKFIIDNQEECYEYDQLVIATGSRPHVPNIEGVHQTGVYTFRNLKDAEFLAARMSRARHVVVVGGGLLGLEAARAMLRFHTKVTLVQQSAHLMNRQLDETASGLLREKVEALGINVVTESGVREVMGEHRVEGVITRDGETIECDTVLLCAGISPNLKLAKDAKLKFGRGIYVDDHMQTSQPDIYAIGECCEHRGLTYGLVNPGYEQAAILADHLTGGHANYLGSLEVSRLKVVGQSVCSMGQVVNLMKRPFQYELAHQSESSYRKVILHKGKVIGAVGLGEWPEARRIQEAYQNNRRIGLFQRLRFKFTGQLFSGNAEDAITQWPDETIVCQCNNISKGELADAIEAGATTVAALQKETSAGTVCGSCKPLLSQLAGSDEPREKEKGWGTLVISSIFAVALAALLVLIPGFQTSDSVQTIGAYEKIWNDGFYKQVTGFTLLGMAVIGLLMSLRKRVKSKKFGQFAYWRVLHVILGLACVATLMLHTGFHMGANLNKLLMIDFLAVIALGALAGVVVAFSHMISVKRAQKVRKAWVWAHILVTWPLPILLGVHILTVYYF